MRRALSLNLAVTVLPFIGAFGPPCSLRRATGQYWLSHRSLWRRSPQRGCSCAFFMDSARLRTRRVPSEQDR